MSATRDIDKGARQAAGTRTGGGPAGAVAAEWVKLWSVRPAAVCLLAAVPVTAVFTFYYASIARINDRPPQPVDNAAVSSLLLVQFAVVVLSMTAVTGEYTTRSIGNSLLWVPVRHRAQGAKAFVCAVVAFCAGTVCGALGTAVAWGPFGGHATFDPGTSVLRLSAMGVYCSLVAVLSVGVSFVLRASAGALTVLFVLISVLPAVLTALGGDVLLTVVDWLPQTAGMYAVRADGDAPYPPGAGFLIMAGWALAAHLAGLYVLRRRDV
ncbi:ABC transporter permease [Streptomyces sp. NPDC014734]|uniref:ABC transporter permease n=1 Tax=Streptomyces sp. NPDC014734 TaxID=3364886 RepID=UPI0036F7B9FB